MATWNRKSESRQREFLFWFPFSNDKPLTGLESFNQMWSLINWLPSMLINCWLERSLSSFILSKEKPFALWSIKSIIKIIIFWTWNQMVDEIMFLFGYLSFLLLVPAKNEQTKKSRTTIIDFTKESAALEPVSHARFYFGHNGDFQTPWIDLGRKRLSLLGALNGPLNDQSTIIQLPTQMTNYGSTRCIDCRILTRLSGRQ